MPMEQRDLMRLRCTPQPAVGMVEKKTIITEEDSLLQKVEDFLLVHWRDLPEWSQDNEYIQSGFRPTSNSYWKSFQSCCYVHNETGNIYSHLLATLWMIALPIWLYPYAKENYPEADADDWIVLGLFFLGGASCFALSTIYHILANHSHTTHDFCHQLDFLGIIVVTAGCFPPGIWYSFPCAARKTKVFWIGVCYPFRCFVFKQMVHLSGCW
jgi:adiponectin receptor